MNRGLSSSSLFAGVEGGGTKFVCAVGSGAQLEGEPVRVPTTEPRETMRRVVAAFAPYRGRLAGLGIGSFGPVDIDRKSAAFGRILETPKLAWRGFDLIGALRDELRVPVRLETDVVAAALGEHAHGAGRGARVLLYLTVGTGIGGGALLDGAPIQGASHAEMGHVPVARVAGDRFEGVCPSHGGACLEGMASGPAIAARWGRPGDALPAEHPAWQLEAQYLAQAICGYALTLAPEIVIIGGGVAEAPDLLTAVRDAVHSRLNGYLTSLRERSRLDSWLVAPQLGSRSGVIGALELARRAAEEK